MNVAFLGLGTMGKPMAANLLRAAHTVAVWNRSPGPAAELATLGATVSDSPAKATHDAKVLITMVADDASTEAVLIDGGALDALAKGALVINMATISVELADALAERCAEAGLAYIAAPVLGRVNVAEAGLLQILAAGDADALAIAAPLFDVMGQKTWVFGDRPSQANAVKLGVNFMLASAIGTMGEAATLAAGHGVDRAAFLEMAFSTVFAAPAYQNYGKMIASETYMPAGFKLALGLKDMRLALAAGEAAHVPMPLAGVLRDNFLDNLAHGEGDLDWAGMAKVSKRRAGQD